MTARLLGHLGSREQKRPGPCLGVRAGASKGPPDRTLPSGELARLQGAKARSQAGPSGGEASPGSPSSEPPPGRRSEGLDRPEVGRRVAHRRPQTAGGARGACRAGRGRSPPRCSGWPGTCAPEPGVPASGVALRLPCFPSRLSRGRGGKPAGATGTRSQVQRHARTREAGGTEPGAGGPGRGPRGRPRAWGEGQPRPTRTDWAGGASQGLGRPSSGSSGRFWAGGGAAPRVGPQCWAREPEARRPRDQAPPGQGAADPSPPVGPACLRVCPLTKAFPPTPGAHAWMQKAPSRRIR